MNKNVRIAFQLRHKDDIMNMGIGELSFSDYQWDKRRYLYHSNGSNEYVLFKDEITDDIKHTFDTIIVDKDSETLHDPCLVFLYQYDDKGNATYSDQVCQKWKDWMKVNYGKTKPHQLYTYTDGLEVGCTPYLHEKCVFTTVRFTGDTSDYADIGKLTEALINQFINIENNLTFRVMKLYDNCMKIAHDLHLLDVNQDARLTECWSKLADSNGIVDEVDAWVTALDYYKAPPKTYTLNLNTSDPHYLYKYKLHAGAKDKAPVFSTSVAPNEVDPTPYAEIRHTRAGLTLKGLFNRNEITDYIRRDLDPYSSWNQASAKVDFVRNPTVPVEAITPTFGDNDNQCDYVSGTVTTTLRPDIDERAYADMPWLQVFIDCYNFSGMKIKTVNGVWDENRSTTLTLQKGRLAGNYTWSANLNGYFQVKVRVKAFWGTFGSWSNEVKLSYVACDGDDNSGGGPFSINKYIFNNQSNRVLTRVVLHDASKYERNIIINGRGYGWGWTGNITWDDNATFSIPGSSNWHYTSWFGRIFAKPGCNYECADWWTRWSSFRKTGTRNETGALNFPDAENYSLLTSVNSTVKYSGLKAFYRDDTYNTPYLFAPITKDCSIMVRGGDTYKLISDCQDLIMTQIGVFKLEVGSIGIQYNDTMYYGDSLILDQDIIIKSFKTNRMYRLETLGNPPSIEKIASGVYNSDVSKNVRKFRRSSSPKDIKPATETGMGYIACINLIRENRLDEYRNKWLEMTLNNGEPSINIKIGYISDTEWTELYNKDNKRVYAIVEDTSLYIMTYYIDNVDAFYLYHEVGNTMELLLRDIDTGLITQSYGLLPYRSELGIPVSVNGSMYYLESTDEKPEDEDPIVLSDKNGENVRYLK